MLGSPYPLRMPASPQHMATRLRGEVGTRLPHTRAVARQASMVSELLQDRWSRAIVDAAWLHDIGHRPAVVPSTRSCPIVARRGFSEETCCLMAWHTGAIHEARERWLGDQLRAEFAAPATSALDALTWADLTSCPSGDLVSPDVRLEEILDGSGPGSAVRAVMAGGMSDLHGSVDRIEQLLGAA
jgi:hypothetical protein